MYQKSPILQLGSIVGAYLDFLDIEKIWFENARRIFKHST